MNEPKPNDRAKQRIPIHEFRPLGGGRIPARRAASALIATRISLPAPPFEENFESVTSEVPALKAVVEAAVEHLTVPVTASDLLRVLDTFGHVFKIADLAVRLLDESKYDDVAARNLRAQLSVIKMALDEATP